MTVSSTLPNGIQESLLGSQYDVEDNQNKLLIDNNIGDVAALKQIATATGTADAILADFTPNITLADKTVARVRLIATNTTTSPTFSPDGLVARTIVKNGGSPLLLGDLKTDMVVTFTYDLANTRWELLNYQVSNVTAQWNADKLQGNPVSATAPALDEALVWDGATWIPRVQNVNGKNYAIAGGMDMWLEGNSLAATNDTYVATLYNLLSDTNGVVDVSQSVDAPSGALNSMEMNVATISKKFGVAHFIEQADAQSLIGGTASISFDAKVTSAAVGRLDNIKAVLLSWTSTADVINSNLVGTWNAEDATPTFATNWTAENIPVNLNVGTTYATYKIENIAVDTASAKNVALFIWSDGLTGTLADKLNISKVKIESGAVATPFIGYDRAGELNKAHRYYQQFDSTTVPDIFAVAGGVSSSQVEGYINLKAPMRTNPTMSFSAASDFGLWTGHTGTSITGSLRFGAAVQILLTVTPTTVTVGNTYRMSGFNANAKIFIDARL